jgi:hypothetical protein
VSRAKSKPAPAVDSAGAPERWFAREMALGLCACAPLFAAYEAFGLDSGARNAAELALTAPLRALGEHEALGRRIALLVGLFACLWILYQPGYSLFRKVARVAGEGLLVSLVFAPLVVVLHRLLDAPVPASLELAIPPPPPSLERAALVVGGAGWEELLFRVLLLALFARLAARFFEPLAGAGRAARSLAFLAASIPAGLVFAAFHLRAVNAPLGGGGEPFDPALFAWRTMSGICLALLYAWRGVGVAAWCHAGVNILLLAGATPGVLL